MPNATRAIEHDLRAKDGNRPDLLRQAFTSAATLHMQGRTDTLAFPAHASGREAIAPIRVVHSARPTRTSTPFASASRRWPLPANSARNGWWACR